MVFLCTRINNKFVPDMKKSLKIVLTMYFLIGVFKSYAQIIPNCETPGQPILWSSDIFAGFDATHCDNDVAIITDSRDIKIRNYIKVGDQKKIQFKPTGDHRIQILPDQNEYNTSLNIAPKIGDRTTKAGSEEGTTQAKDPLVLKLSPNPTNSELVVTISEEITNYYVVNFYGLTLLEGTNLSNNILSVTELPPGLYYLAIQTEAGFTSAYFIKN